MIFLLLANHRSILGMHRAPNESTQPFMPRPGIPGRFGELEALADPPAGLWPMAAKACSRREGQVFAGKPPTLLPLPGGFQSHPIGASQFNSENIALFKRRNQERTIPATSSPVAFIVMTNISWDTEWGLKIHGKDNPLYHQSQGS